MCQGGRAELQVLAQAANLRASGRLQLLCAGCLCVFPGLMATQPPQSLGHGDDTEQPATEEAG